MMAKLTFLLTFPSGSEACLLESGSSCDVAMFFNARSNVSLSCEKEITILVNNNVKYNVGIIGYN